MGEKDTLAKARVFVLNLNNNQLKIDLLAEHILVCKFFVDVEAPY